MWFRDIGRTRVHRVKDFLKCNALLPRPSLHYVLYCCFLSVSKYRRKEEQLIKTMNFNSLTISARVTVLPNVFIVSNPPVAPIAFMIKPSVSPSIWTSASFLMGDSNSWNSQQLWNSHFTWVVADINVFSFVSFFFFTISVPVEIILLNLYSIQR